ncbi:MAG TPA: DUF3566 domain-containing protein, partial [Anaerolineae bacterium]|nr:DUF3566 domain-containing protein [Anaerolineae bacterium]
AGFGAAALIIMPFVGMVIYCIIGSAFSFLFSLLYNIVAGLLGGIEFELGFDTKTDTPSFI